MVDIYQEEKHEIQETNSPNMKQSKMWHNFWNMRKENIICSRIHFHCMTGKSCC